ncbi:hypothetical protein [Pendulispora albinea]|uniref:Uncharacterized protein n=1 Tax=Pendulispora albinea TaxID=2741071 RepID=A0ABZ2M3S7_9BACT
MKKLFAFCSMAIFALGLGMTTPSQALAGDANGGDERAVCSPECEECQQRCDALLEGCLETHPHSQCVPLYGRCIKKCPR